ncbi:tellurite resistance/C4-dicarboxylate transporter family protein [Streptomyces sp. NPDC091279]|uniref:tellurite resistance/C4-dicarboxylate transporter family protein n=1 Tax=Streptomyces sp. NPDC091279 TaxID=3365983 RepID=UPI00382EC59A
MSAPHGPASGSLSPRAWWARRSPEAGAAVLATGILSVGLRLTGHEVLSLIALVLACGAWLVLAARFVTGLLWDRARWMAAARVPGALTAVAATAVLGTRFSDLGRHLLADALLALAAALWPALLIDVVRHWRRRGMSGGVFLACVATQGLAALSGTLAGAQTAAWLAYTALVLFWGGLVLYCVALACFDLRQLFEGAGDQWVAGGALAISALAGSTLLAADDTRLHLWNDDDRGVLRAVTVALLVLAGAWYVVLAVAEAVRPRPRYDVLRWATVFPLGMTAAATLAVGSAARLPWLRGPGQVLLWIAVAGWLAVAVGAARRCAGGRAGIRSTARR